MVKKYNVIYADPAWQFSNKKTGGSMKSGAAAHYDVMKLKDMCALPINELAADDCILFMWWVGSMPKEAIQLTEAWGFKIKTMTGFTWVKLTVTLKLWFGMGFYTRAGSENCLIAIKGKPKRVNASVRSVVKAIIGKHSQKPNVFREQIVKLMGDVPRVELFAREKHDGWDVWGNQVEGSIELPELLEPAYIDILGEKLKSLAYHSIT